LTSQLFTKQEKRQSGRVYDIIGDVSNRFGYTYWDMADTCGTIVKAAEKLKEAQASQIYAIAIHGILSGNGSAIINSSPSRN